MSRLRKIGLWMLVVAGLLPAVTLGLKILSPMILKLDTLNSLLRSPFAHALNIGVWSGPVLALVGCLLVVIGWAGEPSAGGMLGGSRVATWAGICIGVGLGFPLGMAPLLFWSLIKSPLDQGALIIFFTCSEGILTGAVVGGVLGSRRLSSAVLAGSAIGAGLGFTLGVTLISGQVLVLGILPQIVPGKLSSLLLFVAGPAGAALGWVAGAGSGARLEAFREHTADPGSVTREGREEHR